MRVHAPPEQTAVFVGRGHRAAGGARREGDGGPVQLSLQVRTCHPQSPQGQTRGILGAWPSLSPGLCHPPRLGRRLPALPVPPWRLCLSSEALCQHPLSCHRHCRLLYQPPWGPGCPAPHPLRVPFSWRVPKHPGLPLRNLWPRLCADALGSQGWEGHNGRGNPGRLLEGGNAAVSPDGNYVGGSRANTDTRHGEHSTWTQARLGTTKMF